MKSFPINQLLPSELQKKCGSTLIELLIAATITVTVMTAVAISMMYSIQGEAKNRYQESAVMLAQNAVDMLIADRAELGWEAFVRKFNGYDYCLSRNALGQDVLEPKGTACPSTTFGGLAFQSTVTGVAPLTGITDQIELTVSVDWTAGRESSQYVLTQNVFKGVY